MSNLNNLTSKILKDAEERKDAILAEAKSSGDAVISKNIKKAETLRDEILEKAKLEAESRKARVISSANLSARNEQLKAKQEVINKVFNKAVEELNTLSKEEYNKFVTESLKALNLDGTETIIINKNDKEIFNVAFLAELNKELINEGKKGELTLREDGNFKRGFILDRNGIQVNNTFESLVNSLRSDLEFEVTKALFN